MCMSIIGMKEALPLLNKYEGEGKYERTNN